MRDIIDAIRYLTHNGPARRPRRFLDYGFAASWFGTDAAVTSTVNSYWVMIIVMTAASPASPLAPSHARLSMQAGSDQFRGAPGVGSACAARRGRGGWIAALGRDESRRLLGGPPEPGDGPLQALIQGDWRHIGEQFAQAAGIGL